MSLSTQIRRFVPLTVRQEVKHCWRQLHDAAQGTYFAQSLGSFDTSPPIHIIQPVRHSAFYDNKITNITRGAALLNHNLIAPQENWSFWHRVRRPDTSNGFVTGRNLVNGQLTTQTGGGLCQLSSMAYHLALLAGLTIRERHAHSIDIYEEHQRYTPLGADATVVWGAKDLRLFNPYPFAVSFTFSVDDGKLHGAIHAEEAIATRQVDFVREPLANQQVKVHTVVDGKPQASTNYHQRQGMTVRS